MIRAQTIRFLAQGAFVLALAACAPPAVKQEAAAPAPAPAPAAPVAWEAADGPGQSALTWRGGATMITLRCTQKCDPMVKPAPDAPQPICTRDRATLQVAATAPSRAAAKVGDAATLLLGATAFPGKLSADADTQPGMAELRVSLDAAVIAAIAGAINARLVVGEAFITGDDDATGQFKEFAQSCAIHAGAQP